MTLKAPKNMSDRQLQRAWEGLMYADAAGELSLKGVAKLNAVERDIENREAASDKGNKP